MNFKRLNTSDEVKSLLNWHNQNSEFLVIDVETTSLNPREAVLIDIQLNGYTEDSAVIFSGDFVHCLKSVDTKIIFVAHNYKYDAHVLFRHGVDLLDRTWRDTLLIGHLLNENRESYSLDSYVKEYFNDDYKEKFWAKYKTYEEASKEDQVAYACTDILYTRRIYEMFLFRMRTDEDIPGSLVAHVHRLQDSLLRTEISGISIDLKYLEELGVRLKRRIDELGPQMREMVKDEIEIIELEAWLTEINKRKSDRGRSSVQRPEFSFESSQQLANLLYRKLTLPVQRNEKTRNVSTDYESLDNIKSDHPVIELIQENRELQKVYTAYVGGTLDRVDKERIYPNFRVNGTVTGRISHSSPNLAQLPKTGGVRGIYVPDRGRRLISADYGQLEVIVEANLTADKNIVRMLENGESKHDLTARELGCDRSTAKTLNFALQYWCSHYKVAKLLGVSIDEGKRIWERYWVIYAGSKQLKARTDALVDAGTPLETNFGRRRRFAVRKRSPWDPDYRQAYNFLIQGTGADITSRAFYIMSEWLARRNIGRGLFTVHDEILVEVDEKETQEAEKALIAIMEGVGKDIGFQVPLKAVSSGPTLRWED